LKPKPAARKRALIVKLGAIGDVIMAVPAARALSEQGFDIDWVCGTAVYPLLKHYPWIKPIVADDKAIFLGSVLERARAITGLWSKVVAVRYDLCATLYYNRGYRALTLPIRAKRKLMLSRKSREFELLPGRHHTDEFTRILLNRSDSCRDVSTGPVQPEGLPASPLPAKTALNRIALVPGGASNLQRQQILRRWPVESYVRLSEHLLTRGWEVVLLGGPEDEWVRPHFAGHGVTDAIGTLSIPEVVSVCETCDLVVSHDTGPLHMAGLSATPVLGIFGPTDPATRIPRRAYSVGLWGGQGFACRPCYDGTNFAPCEFNGCMHQISVERLLREMDRMLREKSLGLESPWRVVFPDDSEADVLRVL
jgi:heptosyltransferase II